MKTLKITLFAVLGVFLFSANVNAQSAKGPAITTSAAAQKPSSAVKWTEEIHDFEDLVKGVPVSHDFTFINTTKQTVIITDVKASCGCTATNYTKTPIKPGEKGSITATYNAAAQGAFSKAVTVTLNEGEAPKILTIKGKVLE